MVHKNQANLSSQQKAQNKLFSGYDSWLLSISLLLLFFGLVMMTSASISIAAKETGDPLYYFWRQGFVAVISLIVSLFILKIPMRFWETMSIPLLLCAIFLLVLVLIPGVGKEVNGSVRWIQIGTFSLQASESVKLCVIAYLASYLVRHSETVRASFTGIIIPVLLLMLISILLLLEPDFGATAVLFCTALGMLFMAGISWRCFSFWTSIIMGGLVLLAVFTPYRMRRLMSFIDPWEDPFASGHQLVQALISFGRGDWFGVGLGNSVQKLFYLPEAHTDFVFSVIAEELGLIATVVIILVYTFIIWRAFTIGYVAERVEKYFSAYFAYGIGLVIGMQAYINIGVNMGVLPTKGLTLPLMSYGGNSLLVYCVLLAILLRIEYENRHDSHDIMTKTASTYAR